jgi:hypothetical protein
MSTVQTGLFWMLLFLRCLLNIIRNQAYSSKLPDACLQEEHRMSPSVRPEDTEERPHGAPSFHARLPRVAALIAHAVASGCRDSQEAHPREAPPGSALCPADVTALDIAIGVCGGPRLWRGGNRSPVDRSLPWVGSLCPIAAVTSLYVPSIRGQCSVVGARAIRLYTMDRELSAIDLHC